MKIITLFSFLALGVALSSAALSPSVLSVYSSYLNSNSPLLQLWKFMLSIVQNKVSVTNLINGASLMIDHLLNLPALPNFPEDRCWVDSCDGDSTEIRPFTLKFSQERITKLKSKLKNRESFKPALNNTGNTYGTNSKILNTVLDAWSNYDFEAREKVLNEFPQFITKIQGLDIHFIQIKPTTTNKKVLPLLMLHGWPFTAFEYNPVLPYLEIEGEDYVFEIVVPEMPGYGYSQGTNQTGLSTFAMGTMYKILMARLGHDKFYIHGGDVGAVLGANMATMYQENVLGFHTNWGFSILPKTLVKFALGQLNTTAVVEDKYANRMYPLENLISAYIANFGYLHMHAAKPDTLAKGLEDSPSGLMSWILQLLMGSTSGGSQNLVYDDGRLGNWNIINILDDVNVYWDSECITTSIRAYAETFNVFANPTNTLLAWTPTNVPFGVVKFGNEISYMPDSFIMDKYPNLVHSVTYDFGGHSASYENPTLLAASIREAIAKMEVFHASKPDTPKRRARVNYIKYQRKVRD